MSDLRIEAEAAAARGWVLIQLRGKVPVAVQWPTAPSPTQAQLEEWASVGNLGVLTGARSGILVIDVDEAKGGDVAALNLPPTWTAMTGGGGWHLYFHHPATAAKIGNSAGKLAPHVDVRCAGGQVVLVGSVHPVTGQTYEWADGLSPDDLPLADLPDHILTALLPPPAPPRPVYHPQTNGGGEPYARAALDRECASVAHATEGTRNDRLNEAAFNLGTLVGGGMLLEAHAASELLQAARAAGLEEREAAATIRSGMQAGERDPRRPPERQGTRTRPADARPEPEISPPAETSPPRAIDLYDASVIPAHPEFAVAHLFRRAGLHLIWSQPSGGKTWTLLRWMIEMLELEGPAALTGHPDLHVRHRYRKVLWIGTEEDAPGLRAKADQVCIGLGIAAPGGPLLHLWASAPRLRVTLDNLPAILEAEGPLDAIVLDSLTGLRPKMVNGQRVKWDLDNDAANDQCLELRGLAVTHDVAIMLVHHTGRETEKGYRGPTEYWASADVMFGLVPDREVGKTKVLLQKNRDGRVLEPFFLTPNWGPDGFFLDYSGSAVQVNDSAAAVLAFLTGRRTASRIEIEQGAGISRQTCWRALKSLEAEGRIRNTGNSVGKSPIYSLAD